MSLALIAAATSASAETFSADVWADNWFAMRINGHQVAEDSVPITTERSFNAESFTFQAERPFVIGVVAKDFKENDTGLEYIGTRRQQMGDGGLILQIRDAAGNLAAVSNEDWQCETTHTAPLDSACEGEANPVAGVAPCGFNSKPEPAGWDAAAFDASKWPAATLYSAREVGPKDGYKEITWADEAQFIWGPDIKKSNTVLCRLTVE
ncbi:PEBP family protein [Pseudorhodobacter antarcticus]|uniref:PEBP family protein n=1 Tax=Pseudorhodobacter antarcticus TaxID=1077947 RepID=UPI001E3067B6|nr:PEBP family protein [Pseudorhodobacter antarcticus]